MQVSGQFHAPAALATGKESWFPLNESCVGPRVGVDVLPPPPPQTTTTTTTTKAKIKYKLTSCFAWV
jgi:hypothetical protein